jgi:hypothetical protein
MKAADAIGVLADGQPLAWANVEEAICLRELATGGEVNEPITIENCVLASLDATFCSFERPVLMQNVRVIGDISFFSCCFFQGLRISYCEFGGQLDLQCGGHNKGENAVIFECTTFHEFVNFFDCQFEGPFVMRNCTFSRGTNLLGNKGRPYEVLFEIPPKIEQTTGELARDGG